MGKTIGILGGMGPLATADLFRKITLLTDAACDNEHIRVYIDSNARIPDRTAAILSGGPDPVPEMASALRSLERCGADCGVSVTGLAGPDGDGTGRPVGLVYIAIDTEGFSFCRELHLTGDRAAIRTQAAEAVFQLLLDLI